MLKIIFPVFLCALVCGCGAGSGSGLDSQGLPLTLHSSSISNSSAQSSSQNAGVTLTRLQTTIFGAICIACHTGSTAPHGLRLDSEENSYAFLVNHPADEIPELMRVNPGNPNDSYIIRKLEGAAGIVGGRMPLGGPYLSQTQINSVRDWIANGAPRSGTGTALTKVSNVAIKQFEAQQFSANLHFSRTIQPETFHRENVALTYSTPNAPAPIPVINFEAVALNQSLDIFTQDIPSDARNISLTIHTNDDAPLLDIQRRAFDGNADETEGGEFHYEYIR